MRSRSWFASVVVAAGCLAGCSNNEESPAPSQPGPQPGAQGTTEQQQQPAEEPGGAQQQQQQQVESHALDGRTFSVVLIEPGAAPIQDDLIFRDGTLDSTACRQYGFSPAPYQAEKTADGAVRFTANARSGDGTMRWEGTARGDQITGKAVSSKPGQAPVEYTFEGSAKR